MKLHGIARILVVSLGAVLALAAAIYFLRAPILSYFLKGSLARAGLLDPGFTIRHASFAQLQLTDVRIGAADGGEAVALETLTADFDFWRLIRERAVEKIALGPGVVEIDVAADGAVSISGMKIGGAGGGAGVTVGAIDLAGLRYRIAGATGVIEGDLSGALDLRKGGALAFSAAADDYSVSGVHLKAWTQRGDLQFDEDGALSLVAEGGGDLKSAAFALRGVVVDVAASGESWLDLLAGRRDAIAAKARFSFRSAPSPASENPLIASVFALRQGPEAETFALDGAGTFARDAAGFELDFGGSGSIRIKSNGGDELLISALNAEAPAFARANGKEILALKAAVSGAALGGGASLSAERADGAPWSFNLESAFANQTLWSWKLGPTALTATGTMQGSDIAGDASIETLVREAHIGRLSILDAPIDSAFRLEMDMKTRTYAFFSDPDACLRMARGNFRLAGQDSETELRDARLCRADGPLIVWRGSDAPQADVKGRLTARTGGYRIGATRLDGLPPVVDLEAQYHPKLQQTDVSGTLSNGVVVINNAVVATDAKGIFTGRLDPKGLSGEARLSAVTLTQNVPAPQLAPISATGSARLAEEKVTFDYAAATEGGRAIGEGAGSHDVRRGVGTTTYRSGELVFAPGKLQPAQIVSALTGIVSSASGAAAAEATFVWGRRPSDFKSSGALSLKNLTFIGPGRAVNRTHGVAGDIVLESLTPLKTAGEQKIAVSAVDMDALQLEQGEIVYALPGDGTMRISSATFPWFGGRLGAYDATASLNGAAIDTALKAENVDLAQLLDYLQIEGLSGEGVIEGNLPLKIVGGKARIVEGFFSAKGPGVIRYVGKAGEAAAAANSQAKFAFDILRDLHFDELTARIDGPLDGDLKFNIVFKGANEVTVEKQKVTSPVVYRISLEAPLLALIDQARLSSDIKLQIEQAGGTIDDGQ